MAQKLGFCFYRYHFAFTLRSPTGRFKSISLPHTDVVRVRAKLEFMLLYFQINLAELHKYKLHCISQTQQTLLLYLSFLGNMFRLLSSHLRALQELHKYKLHCISQTQ